MPPTRIIFALLLVAAAPAGARTVQQTDVDKAEALTAAGQYAEARELLARWWKRVASRSDEADSSLKARALLLRARLEPDPRTAEEDYLAVVLGYPTSAQAPEALLRLAQAIQAGGDATRAAGYLDRLIMDYPNSPHRATGLLWLARIHRTAGRRRAACDAAGEAIRSGEATPDLVALLRVEEASACDLPGVAAVTPERPAPAPSEPRPQPPAGDRLLGRAATPARSEPRRPDPQTSDRLLGRAAPPARTEPPRPDPQTSDRVLGRPAPLPGATQPEAARPAPALPPAARPTPATPPRARPAPEAGTGSFAVQLGAFRDPRGADGIAGALRRGGFEPRVVYVPGNALLRVRVGRFPRQADAAAMARRLRAAGFQAIVVADADRERSR